MTRRELLGLLAALGVTSPRAFAQLLERPQELYQLPPYGDLTLLFLSDLHAQLLPHYYMEPPNLLAPKPLMGRPGYLAGEAMLRYFGLKPGSLEAYLASFVDFQALAERFGPLGGGAQIAALIQGQRAQAKKALVLEGGDNWTNSGLSLLTRGGVMVDWMNRVGFDHLVFHWEWTLGRARVEELLRTLRARPISFNVTDDLFGDPIFPPYALHEAGGYTVAVIGSTYPYVKVSHPEEFTEGLSFGLRERELAKLVEELRGQGVDAIVLLSHNGLPLDTALAGRVPGIDLILSGHTHDLTFTPVRVGKTYIVAGSTAGKALIRVDLKLKKGGIAGLRLRVLPVASRLLPQDPQVAAFIEEAYAPHKAYLFETLAVSESLIYKRDTVYSTFDELAGRAVRAFYPEVEVVFSPGTRWGTTILPGEAITRERVLAYTAFTYPEVYVFRLKGERLKAVLEDVAANVFSPDPFYQQGGDMSRAYGLRYTLNPDAPTGSRILDLQVGGKPWDPHREYVVAAYGGRLQRAGTPVPGVEPKPIYEILAAYLKAEGRIRIDPKPNVRVVGRNYRVPEVKG